MKIALIGYGKMGHMIERIARQRGHDIVSIIDIDNRDDFDSDAFRSADVAIEFTTPTAAYDNYVRAFAQGVKVVSGSTGWPKEHLDDVKRLIAEGNTLFWASNFSVGVAIFAAVSRYLARIMNAFPQYDATMVETHHVHKLDAPSGTAITLAEDICANLDRKTTWAMGTLTAPDGSVSARAPSPARATRPTAGASTPYAAARCGASTPSPTTARPTASPSPTMPTPAKASPSAPSSPPNIR